MSDLRDAAEAVLEAWARVISIEYRQPEKGTLAMPMYALRAALSGVPEGAASEDDDVEYGEYGVPNPGWVPQRSVPSPEPLDVATLRKVRATLAARRDDLLWCMKDDDCDAQGRGVALAITDIDALAAPQPVPEDET